MKRIIAISICLLIINSAAKAQDSLAIAAADTTHFSINSASGWELFNSYFELRGADSCDIEMVFQHSNNIDWSAYHQIGSLKTNAYKPTGDQILSFNMGQRSYFFKIDSQGNCWIKKENGNAHDQDKVVLAFRHAYKK